MIVKTFGYRNETRAAWWFPKANASLAFVADLSDRNYFSEGGLVKTVILFEIGNGDEGIQ